MMGEWSGRGMHESWARKVRTQDRLNHCAPSEKVVEQHGSNHLRLSACLACASVHAPKSPMLRARSLALTFWIFRKCRPPYREPSEPQAGFRRRVQEPCMGFAIRCSCKSHEWGLKTPKSTRGGPRVLHFQYQDNRPAPYSKYRRAAHYLVRT